MTAGAARAATIALSTFDTGADGWTVGNFYNTIGSSAPTYVASGGNPGGFIRTGDLYSWNSYWAPAAFLGNKAAAYGGSLSLDMAIVSSDNWNYSMVVISDGSTRLQFETAPPGSSWTTYNIPLLASAGWQVAPGNGSSGPAASESQLMTVLSNLAFLHLDADWSSVIEDRVDLDNVALCGPGGCVEDGSGGGGGGDVDLGVTEVPEPASLLLLGSGLAAMARFCRRTNRS